MAAPVVSDTSTVLFANPSADLYGSDRMALETVRGLTEDGHKVVFTCSVEGPLTQSVREAGAQVVVLPSPVVRKAMLSPSGLISLVRSVVSEVPRMRGLVRRVNPDVVVVNTVSNPFWNVAARWARTPVLVYVHEAEASLRSLIRKVLVAPLNLATGVIYNSETSRTVSRAPLLEKRGKTRVVYNGVEGPPEVIPPRTAIDSPLRVAFIGRLSPRKGVDLLVDAAALLRNRGVPVDVEIVGDVFPGYEWYEEELRQRIADKKVEDRVHLVGFQERVWSALARSDVMVVPSRLDESFGNVVVEAALSARPVLVADHSGLKEASAGLDAAILVVPDDAEAIVEGLMEVSKNWDTLREAAIRDSEFAADRYSPESYRRTMVRTVGELKTAK